MTSPLDVGTSKKRRISPARAQRVVARWIEEEWNERNLFDFWFELRRDLRKYHHSLLTSLVDSIDSTSGLVRSKAVWLLVLLTSDETYAGSPKVREMAIQAFGNILADEKGEGFEVAISCLALQSPPDFKPRLLELLKQDDEVAGVMAASALLSIESNSKAIAVVRSWTDRALPGAGTMVAIRAITLYEKETRDSQTVNRLFRAFKAMDEDGKFVVLLALDFLGERASSAKARLTAFISDPKVDDMLRCMAASVLGKVASSRDCQLSLLPLMASNDSYLVAGAIRGLVTSGGLCVDAIPSLEKALSSDLDVVRFEASKAIIELGASAVELLPVMLDRLAAEADGSILLSLSEAIAAVGPGAIPQLVEVIKSGDMRRLPMIGVAIKNMGVPGVRALIENMKNHWEYGSLAIFLSLVRDLPFSSARELMLAVSDFLDESDDEEHTEQLLRAVAYSGQAARYALPSLIRQACTCSDDLFPYVELTLWNIGPPAVVALDEILLSCDAEVSQRLTPILLGARSFDADRFSVFESLLDDRLIRNFVSVAKIVEGCETTSSRELQAGIKQREAEGEQFDSLRTSPNALLGYLHAMEESLDVGPLTTMTQGRSGELTDAGLQVLRDAEKYLTWKDLRSTKYQLT